MVPGIKLRILYMLGKYSTNKLNPSPLFSLLKGSLKSNVFMQLEPLFPSLQPQNVPAPTVFSGCSASWQIPLSLITLIEFDITCYSPMKWQTQILVWSVISVQCLWVTVTMSPFLFIVFVFGGRGVEASAFWVPGLQEYAKFSLLQTK